MKNNKLYNLVIKADKEAENIGGCGTCFCGLIKENIENSTSLNKSFVNWKNKNNIYTICSSVLFYLQDLGIIKILYGAAKRTGGVKCTNFKIKVLPKGNKI